MSWSFLTGPLCLLATALIGGQPGEPQIEAAPAATPPASITPQLEVLALEIERYRRLTVPIHIKGEGPFRFIVDTGAQATVISHDLAELLQLTDRKPATLVGLNSLRPVEVATIPEVSFGSRSFAIHSAPLVEAANIGIADGILGLDGLQRSRVLLDFRTNELTVADAKEDRSRAGYDIVVRARRKLGQLIIAEATIDGVRTALIVDTGAQSSIGNPALGEKLRRARDLGTGQMTDINGVETSGTVRVARQLDIGRARLQNFAIVFTDSPTFHVLGLEDQPALLLGMSELRLFNRVAIDFDRREVLFDLPSSARWPS